MPDKDAIIAAVEAYIVAFADKATYVGCFAEDGWLEDPVGTPVVRGHAEIGAFWERMAAMGAPSLELTGSVRVAGGEAAFPMRAVVTLGDDTLAMPIIDVMTFDDDAKITSMRAFWDMAELAPVED
jgi:steroid delta-isomerase